MRDGLLSGSLAPQFMAVLVALDDFKHFFNNPAFWVFLSRRFGMSRTYSIKSQSGSSLSVTLSVSLILKSVFKKKTYNVGNFSSRCDCVCLTVYIWQKNRRVWFVQRHSFISLMIEIMLESSPLFFALLITPLPNLTCSAFIIIKVFKYLAVIREIHELFL